MPVGISGRFESPVAIDELVRRTGTLYQQEPIHFAGGDPYISSVGVVSGGSTNEVYTALDAGLDAFITGEPREWVMNIAREAGIHVLTAGHYATERLGPRALGEHLAKRFALDVTFIDVPNPA
jgi:putative NIF3 family GTP cyclohydrolase 1 type 2